jgi:hypothetical protein
MGKYLAALKQLEAGGKKTEKILVVTPINQNNSATSGNLGLLGTPLATFPEKNATQPTIHACSRHTESLAFFDNTTTDLPKLCELLGLAWEQVEDAGILEPYDQGMIDGGAYDAFWVIRYLLSWQAGGYCVPFGLLRDEVISQQLEKLQLAQPDGESVRVWLSVNIRKKSGDTV